MKRSNYTPLTPHLETRERDDTFSPDHIDHRPAPTHRNLSLWLAALATFVSVLTFAHNIKFAHNLTKAHHLAEAQNLAFARNLTTQHSTPSVAPSPIGVKPPFRRIVVGNRNLGPHYTGCDSVKLRRAIAGIRVNPDGAARNVPPTQSDNLDDFDFSFDWPTGCPRPHHFTAVEACDVVGAFGALVLHGDSFTRHLVYALFMILRDRPDGAEWNSTVSAGCRGDRQFEERLECGRYYVDDAHQPELPEPVCGGNVRIMFRQIRCQVNPEEYLPQISRWRAASSPSSKLALSPVLVQSIGIHCHFLPWVPLLAMIKPLLSFARTQFPAPIPVWMGVHAPASNKPLKYLEEQGADQVQAYNTIMEREINSLAPGAVLDGGIPILDWYGLTQSAKSFDGSHYMYQINMEKAQLLLNLLDVLWQEAVAAGGLWDLATLCPTGKEDYRCSEMSDYQ